MKRLALVLGCLLSGAAFAGDKIGNGGGTWTCRASELAAPTQAMLIDFFEAREQHKLTIRQAPPATAPLVFVDQLAREFDRQFPAYAPLWWDALHRTKSALQFVNAELEVVDDSRYLFRPPNSSCAGGKWYYTQFANFTHEGHVLVAKELWESPLLTVEEKAGLIWHEVVYLWLRESYGDVNSVRARFITGVLFSTRTAQEKAEMISKVITAPLPRRQDWFCRIENSLTSGVFGAYGASELEAQTAAAETCKRGGYEFHCSDHNVVCEKLQADNISWTCVAENALNGRTFVGRGRIQKEAEFRAQESCQAQTIKRDWLQCTARAPKCSGI